MAKESCLIAKKNKNLERTEARSSTSESVLCSQDNDDIYFINYH